VNFALKASIVASFLGINGIKYTPGSETSAFKPEELADQAKSMSVFALCKMKPFAHSSLIVPGRTLSAAQRASIPWESL